MKIQKQLSIFLQNRPGGLAKICNTLADAGINILAMAVHDTMDHAVIRLVCDHHIKALLLLEQEGLYLLEQDVMTVSLDNRPGALAEIAQKLGRADVNIDYAYCSTAEHNERGCLVLKVDDMDRAQELLRDCPE